MSIHFNVIVRTVSKGVRHEHTTHNYKLLLIPPPNTDLRVLCVTPVGFVLRTWMYKLNDCG